MFSELNEEFCDNRIHEERERIYNEIIDLLRNKWALSDFHDETIKEIVFRFRGE